MGSCFSASSSPRDSKYKNADSAASAAVGTAASTPRTDRSFAPPATTPPLSPADAERNQSDDSDEEPTTLVEPPRGAETGSVAVSPNIDLLPGAVPTSPLNSEEEEVSAFRQHHEQQQQQQHQQQHELLQHKAINSETTSACSSAVNDPVSSSSSKNSADRSADRSAERPGGPLGSAGQEDDFDNSVFSGPPSVRHSSDDDDESNDHNITHTRSLKRSAGAGANTSADCPGRFPSNPDDSPLSVASTLPPSECLESPCMSDFSKSDSQSLSKFSLDGNSQSNSGMLPVFNDTDAKRLYRINLSSSSSSSSSSNSNSSSASNSARSDGSSHRRSSRGAANADDDADSLSASDMPFALFHTTFEE